MPKQPLIPEITSETSEKLSELPTEIPTGVMLTVEESIEDPELVTTTTIPLSPRDITNQKAREAREARKLPPIPGYAPSLEQLVEWFKLLDEDMWSHVTPYLYRKWPVIVRQLSDPENKSYIDMICKEHVDKGLIEYLQNTHGGGTYKFIINDLDLKTPRGNSKSIMEPSFKINENDFPPILNLKEIDVNDKKNMGFINQMVAKGLMDNRGNIMQPQQNGSGQGSAELAGAIGGMYDKFMTTFATMSKDQQAMITKLMADGSNRKPDPEGIGALLLEKLKQDDPSKQTQTMMTMITTMMSLIPKPEKQDTSVFQLLITQMQQSAERQMEMMKMMFQQQQNNQPAPDKDDFIDKFIKYRTALPELFGNGGKEPKKELGELILEGAREFVLPAIGLASQFMQLNKGVNPIVPVTEQQAREAAGMQGMQPQPQQKVISMPQQPQQPQPPVQDAVKDPNTGQPIVDPKNLSPCQQLLMKYGGILINAIKSGMNGAALADNLEEASENPIILSMLGGNLFQMLKAQGGEEILKAMESIPEFWNQTGKVYGKEYMEQLIADFLIDPTDEDEGDEEGQHVPVK